MNKYQVFKRVFFVGMLGFCSLAFANYESRVEEINNLIKFNEENIKSTEKLDIPEYKGDVLTFERLSKIRNIFNFDHYLPFERKEQVIRHDKEKKTTFKLKPIVIPPELKKIMNSQPSIFQRYPIDSLKFKGVLNQNNKQWGIVENLIEGKPMYIKKGDLVGFDYGRVEDITKKGIVVKEWKKNENKRVWEKVENIID
ncbi:MAG: pilus assembly protein PilP [Francisella sp.]